VLDATGVVASAVVDVAAPAVVVAIVVVAIVVGVVATPVVVAFTGGARVTRGDTEAVPVVSPRGPEASDGATDPQPARARRLKTATAASAPF
jgi:hypothetical protein